LHRTLLHLRLWQQRDGSTTWNQQRKRTAHEHQYQHTNADRYAG
jgi:hypothetical protein